MDGLHFFLITIVIILVSYISTSGKDVQELIPKPNTTRKDMISGSKILDFMLSMGSLKIQRRTGWVDNGIEDAESISDHMHRMSVLGLLVAHPTVDRHRLALICAVHDLAEAIVGDITPTQYSGVSNSKKHEMEEAAIKEMVGMLNGNEDIAKDVYELWCEYENQSTIEGKMAKELDKLEMCIQAYEYEKKYKILLSGFYSSSDKYLKHLRPVFDEILSRRKTMISQWDAEGVSYAEAKRKD